MDLYANESMSFRLDESFFIKPPAVEATCCCSLCVKGSQLASESSSKWWLVLISRWDDGEDPRLLLEMAPLHSIPENRKVKFIIFF